MEKLVERFIKYVKIETTSNESSINVPSTKNQMDFGNELVKELENIGLDDVSIDENGYVMATLPSNIDKDVQTVGFIAHMDTSPDMTGLNVKPNIVKNYQGGDIILNKDGSIILSPEDFPELNEHIGLDLITTDGTTLLGADNKAGIAEIITAMEYLVENPDIQHGTVKIAFTPDEEIGRGADNFNVEKFGADFAYTVDGGPIGELQYENFNASSARISIQGRNVHPGSAKNKMINSITVAAELNSMLPVHEIPEATEGYEGFFHIVRFDGTVEKTNISYIIRDHDMEKFQSKKKTLESAVNFLNEKYGKIIELDIKDSYYNMKEKIEPHMYIIDIAKKAMEEVDIEPIIEPIRGGTDGSKLSYMGLPCPNLFTGGLNYHGRYEYISIQGMEKAVDTILKIIEIVSKK